MSETSNPRKEPDGAALIAAERARQLEVEGWSTDHDDEQHPHGELAKAAAAYALLSYGSAHAWEYWPWKQDWKPGETRIRTLVKSGALIAAEIDRLQRSEPSDA